MQAITISANLKQLPAIKETLKAHIVAGDELAVATNFGKLTISALVHEAEAITLALKAQKIDAKLFLKRPMPVVSSPQLRDFIEEVSSDGAAVVEVSETDSELLEDNPGGEAGGGGGGVLRDSPEKKGPGGEAAQASCQSLAFTDAHGTGTGSKVQTTILSSTVSPSTIQTAINDATKDAMTQAAAAMKGMSLPSCTAPCVPVFVVVLDNPTTTTTPGISATGSGSVTGLGSGTGSVTPGGVGGSTTLGTSGTAGGSVSTGALEVNVTAYVNWTIAAGCVMPQPPAAGGSTASGAGGSGGPQPPPPRPPGGGHTIFVGGQPVTVTCPHPIKQDKVVKHGESKSPADRSAVVDEATQEASAAAAAALVTLPPCPQICPVQSVTVTIGPIVVSSGFKVDKDWKNEEFYVYTVDVTVNWTAERVCS
jgi:hypothetical protein